MKKLLIFLSILGILIFFVLTFHIINYLIPTYYAFGDYDYKNGEDYPTEIKDYNKVTYKNGVKAKVVLRKKGNKKSVCFINDNLICFENNNYNYENKHIQEVFKSLNSGKCEVGKLMTVCNDNNFYCYIDKDGSVECEDETNAKYCSILTDGSTSCGNYE